MERMASEVSGQILAALEAWPLSELLQQAAAMRRAGHGNVISYSRKVFHPPDAAMPRRLRLLHLRQGAAPAEEGRHDHLERHWRTMIHVGLLTPNTFAGHGTGDKAIHVAMLGKESIARSIAIESHGPPNAWLTSCLRLGARCEMQCG